MTTQSEKARQFQSYHASGDAFIIPNPWDIGSARLLALAGFKALATSSAGYAFSRGLPDNSIGREQMMVHLAEIAAATDLPVSADLENGFGDAPEEAAETIRQAAAVGVVGGSIEDATGRADEPIYPFDAAVERVRAAVEAARALPFPFTLTARAENYLNGRPDLDDTIRRLQAFQEAGADVLYAPGLKSREDIAAVVAALDRPVNVLMGLQGVLLGFDELRALGVRRVSVGGSLARAALGAFLRAAHEMRDHGTFTFTSEAASGNELNQMFTDAERMWGKPHGG
ncbi:2-methylisocitrate lyase-like PEP mutase family enzyme [Paraburkholderia sp. GAS199]|uniref:isocitrate lyase/PEP mutase family protein n=1 Tax=Paraburkholderia sp. GAS199 TaxID=3035126 RepID=UPI003D1D98A0